MALTILQRPEGFILEAASTQCQTPDFGSGFVHISYPSHGLSDGDVVYIDSIIEDYGGFVEAYPSTTGDPTNYFNIRQIGQTTNVVWLQLINVNVYKTILTHGWSCAHLPIVYRISNTLWPTNSVDTARTILTLNDDLGYARVTLSGTLGTFEDLSFVKISGASNSDFDGVYQILDKLSTSNITLNVAYSTFNNSGLIGASIQLYYGNYNVVVRVYAGINASHEWASQKPYELAATLELIPDENNQVFFSINEILKAYVKSVNNLLIGTMPNNIDAWTNFYISIAEQYDTSNGYTVGTNISSFTSDQSTFEGTAVNALLPFKNIHSGNLSEYLMTNSTAKFLTLFTIPVLFSCGDDTPDCYNDISFLNPYDDVNLIFREAYYLNGSAGATNDTDLGTRDQGVIRASLSSANCNYDRVDILVFIKTEDFTNANTRFVAGQTVEDISIFIAAGQDVTTVFKYSTDLAIISGVTAGDSASWSLYYVHDDGTTTLVDTGSRTTVGNDVQTNVSFPNPSKNVIAVRRTMTIVDAPATGLDAAVAVTLVLSADLESSAISETKQFDIDCGCADQELRLTWLNYLGGFDYWVFTTETGHAIDITSTTETTKNILPEWPKSYGETADTIRKQTSRESFNRIFLTTQYLTEDQADAVAYIKTSPLVQVINSRGDRRTLIVDSDSFTKYTDNQKLITISFNARYTDNIGSQKV